VAYLRLTYGALGVTAHIHVSWLDPCKVRRVTAVGSRRMVVYNDLSTEERIRIFDKGVMPSEDVGNGQIPMSYRNGEIRSPYLTAQEPLDIQDRHFLDCVEQGLQPTTHGENGAAVVRVLEGAEVSLREGRSVDLDSLVATNGRSHPFPAASLAG
jgi:predicted dehydrogenase